MLNSQIGAVFSFASLSAQASASGASASVASGELRIGAAAAGGLPGYDVNAIAKAEWNLETDRINAAIEDLNYYENTSLERQQAEATERAVYRLNRKTQMMSRALEKLGAGPLAEGQRILSLFSNVGPGAVAIQTDGSVDSLYLRGGDQAVSIRARSVESVYSGGGHAAIAIEADNVETVHTETTERYVDPNFDGGRGYLAVNRETVSNDAVAIKARRASSIYTGGGQDAVAVQADLVRSIYTGEGQDSISVSGGVVSGIHGEGGSDAITVNAAIGMSVMRNVRQSSVNYGNTPHYARPDNAEDRMRLAATNYADIQGGAGADAISVTVQEVISVNAGAGDDLISIGGGTVGLRAGAGSGHDTVQLAKGSELMVQIDKGDYAVELDGNDMVIRHSGGSVRVKDYQQAGAIGVTQFGAAQYRANPVPGSPEAQRMEAERKQVEEILQTAKRVEVVDLEIRAPSSDLNIEIARAGHGFDMLFLGDVAPMDQRA